MGSEKEYNCKGSASRKIILPGKRILKGLQYGCPEFLEHLQIMDIYR